MTDVSGLAWDSVRQSLDERGFATIGGLLSEGECTELKHIYEDASRYRNVVDMRRYRFGQGEYKYFNYPLPQIVQDARQLLYPHLASSANEWMRLLDLDERFPAMHEQLLAECRLHGQQRPTPLILRYLPGGFNTLHQDLYGDVYFPFQVLLLLSQPGVDFTGGEFVLVEQVPRAQSRAHVVPLQKGDALIFTTNFRPAKGARGYYRATMKHGIAEVHSGERFALGVIFHDAT